MKEEQEARTLQFREEMNWEIRKLNHFKIVKAVDSVNVKLQYWNHRTFIESTGGSV